MVDFPPVSASASALTPRRTYPIVGAAYLVQGVVYGLGAFIVLPYLAAAGVSRPLQAVVLALAGLPWVLKLGWAPLIDRTRARSAERTIAVVATLAVALALAALGRAWAPREHAGIIAGAWLAINVALSLQDVAIDAVVLRTVVEARRGRLNAWMLVGHHLGLEGLAGIGGGMLAARHGVPWVLVTAAIGVGLLAWAPAGLPRAANDRRVTFEHRVIDPDPARWGWAAVALLCDVGTSAVSAALLVEELRWEPADVALRLASVSLLGTMVGMAIAGWVVDRVGHRVMAASGGIALGVVWLGFSALHGSWTRVEVVLGIVALQGIVAAPFYVGLHAWLMDGTPAGWRATTFAVRMAALNLPRLYAPPLAVAVLEATGWVRFFLVCGLVQIFFGVALGRRRVPRDQNRDSGAGTTDTAS